MNSVVIYGSHFGNTKHVAEAIARVLATRGHVDLIAADEAPSTLPTGTDLLVVGGPIEAFRMTEPVADLLDRLDPVSVDGVASAAFETRVRPHWWLPGSSARGIVKGLERLGARLISAPESFLVEGRIDEAHDRVPTLVEGELDHAERWASTLASSVEADRLMAAVP